MLIAIVAGALLGIMVGTIGGGGAVLAVPVLVYLLDQPVHAATTASLVVVIGAAGAGAAGHALRGAVCWRLAAVFSAAAVPGSIAGTAANRAVGGSALLAAFAVLLLAVAALTWRRGPVNTARDGDRCTVRRSWMVGLAGAGVGVVTGLFGVGGGFAIVPVLALIFGVPFRRAIATSLVIVTIVSATGLAGHLVAGGQVDWSIALPFALAATITAAFGGRIASRLPRAVLARAFAVLLAVVAIYLLVSVAFLGGPPHG